MMFFLVLFIHFIIFVLSLPINSYNKITSNIEKNIYYTIVVNFYNFIFYRPLAIYAFDLLSREVMQLLFLREYKIINYILLFVYFSLLIAVYIWYLIYIKNITIWTNTISFDESIKTFPFDHYSSSKYDVILLTIKLIIAVNKNYEYFNGKIIDYIILFNIFLIIVIFYGYSVYLIYIYFFSDNCLYISNNFYNLKRYFDILLIFELIPL